MFNLKAEVKLKGTCKHCGETFELFKPFEKHLAYEHGIYHSKWLKFKAAIRRVIIKIFKESKGS